MRVGSGGTHAEAEEAEEVRSRMKAIAKVQRGAALLDKLFPSWGGMIDWNRLDLREGVYFPSRPESCGCIAAQLDAHINQYEKGLFKNFVVNMLRLDRFESDRHGFSDSLFGEYSLLTDEWRKHAPVK